MLRRPPEEMLMRRREGLVARPLCLSRLSGEPGSEAPAEPQMERACAVCEKVLLHRPTHAPAL